VALALVVPVVLAAERDEQTALAGSGQSSVRLECGDNRSGTKAAVRQLVEILRRGEEDEIRAVLMPRIDFGWLSVHVAKGRDLVARGPGEAARKVARRGGLPMEVTRFENVGRPNRNTDAGFVGRWRGERHLNGKTALNCNEGRAIVLSIGVPP
jgi:hypothetical protein